MDATNKGGGGMRTLFLMTAKVVRRFAMLTLLLSPLALLPAQAEANTITLGEIELTGSFTVIPNNESFSSFGVLTVTRASGIFTPLAARGDALVMNVPYIRQPSATDPTVWSIGGYTMNTTNILITGADIAGRFVEGQFDLSGHGFEHAHSALGAFGFWEFTTPPFDHSIPNPVTGPITLTIHEAFQNNGHGGLKPSSLLLRTDAFDNGHVVPEPSSLLLRTDAFDNGHVVPEPGSFLLLVFGLGGLAFCRRLKGV
jgi:PEP-CTERM motif